MTTRTRTWELPESINFCVVADRGEATVRNGANKATLPDCVRFFCSISLCLFLQERGYAPRLKKTRGFQEDFWSLNCCVVSDQTPVFVLMWRRSWWEIFVFLAGFRSFPSFLSWELWFLDGTDDVIKGRRERVLNVTRSERRLVTKRTLKREANCMMGWVHMFEIL